MEWNGMLSGMVRKIQCRARKTLKNKSLLLEIGVDTTGNEPAKVFKKGDHLKDPLVIPDFVPNFEPSALSRYQRGSQLSNMHFASRRTVFPPSVSSLPCMRDTLWGTTCIASPTTLGVSPLSEPRGYYSRWPRFFRSNSPSSDRRSILRQVESLSIPSFEFGLYF